MTKLGERHRGASGAKVKFFMLNQVQKLDRVNASRLIAQAEYMQSQQKYFPKVLFIGSHGYVMRQCQEPDGGSFAQYLPKIVLKAQKLWSETIPAGADKNFSWDKHWTYIANRARIYLTGSEFVALRKSFTQRLWHLHHSTSGCIHGDLTWSNVMLDKAGRIIFIDPQQPNSYIPSKISVDLGKLLQSAYGYDAPKSTQLQQKILSTTSNPSDAIAAVWWLKAHLIRLMPYHNKKVISWAVGVINDLGI